MRVAVATVAAFSLFQGLNAAPAKLEARQNTRHDLQSGACTKYTLIFARGTAEPAGNLGSVGTPFAAALAAALGGGLSVQGVDYGASAQGAIAGGDPAGTQAMVNWVNAACSDTKIILGGYSQGAQLVHNSVTALAQAQANKIHAIVTFGDPKKSEAYGKGLQAKSMTYCHAGDTICAVTCAPTNYMCLIQNMQVQPPHTTYPQDVATAAAWVKSIVG
ncbi:hypothetical protein H072_2140 [Dactylellina haptotyla CBS 200.50]|uniref:cutinase n=1 Tax=Dactylellina haptotyla (strain CBS 200.50) TaxID=1284197 RepID=S8ASF8_DACHA|nr:hypothetical protein H072_2140 [Dactylellina haptotyla CBS 200.50]